MGNERRLRLIQAAKEFNVGISTIMDFLQKKGFEIKEDPNAVVPEEGYNLLMEEFSTDKNVRLQSDKFTKERQNKDKSRSTVVETVPVAEPVVEEKPLPEVKATEVVAKPEPVKEVVKEELKQVQEPKIKIMGTIDLDALNRKPAKKQEKETNNKKVEKTEPVKEVVKEEPKQTEAPIIEKVEIVEEVVSEKESTPQPSLTQIDEVKPNINIIGKIDLSSINQQTRPKKKSKEEKRKEREEYLKRFE